MNNARHVFLSFLGTWDESVAYRGGGGFEGGSNTPTPAEIPKALQNSGELNTIV